MEPPSKKSKARTLDDPVEQVRAESAVLSKLSSTISLLQDCELVQLRAKKLDKLTGKYIRIVSLAWLK